METLSLTAQAHRRLGQYVQPGDILVDATAGNGYDTLFLAERTGPAGWVYAFDVQQSALEITGRRLAEHGAADRCRLVHAGHEHMAKNITPEHHGKIRAVMFNLGYLPGAAKEITTRAEMTISALDQSLRLIGRSGIISLLVYKGHPEGKKEGAAIREWLTRNEEVKREVDTGVDPDDASPVLWILRKD